MNSVPIKRKAKTSNEQYIIYLETLEKDEILRTGIINPTVEKDYIKIKWNALTQKLNSCGSGPQLSVKEWEKRFTIWKCVIKSKYRSYKNMVNGTGGGPPPKNPLSQIEERAIDVWGRVTVDGIDDFLIEGGFEPDDGPSFSLNSNNPKPSTSTDYSERISNKHKKQKTNHEDFKDVYIQKMDEVVGAINSLNTTLTQIFLKNISSMEEEYID